MQGSGKPVCPDRFLLSKGKPGMDNAGIFHAMNDHSEISKFQYSGLGEAWINLNTQILQNGELINDELYELRHINFSISEIDENDRIINKYANQENISNMIKVFSSNEKNIFGHSYKDSFSGPMLRKDFSDVIEVLKSDKDSKKGAVVLVGSGNKVPCIQSIHFLIRNNKLETSYFARAQDAYVKLYADIIAIFRFSGFIAGALCLETGHLHASIVSLHIYKKDIPYAKKLFDDITGSK
jgi:thymidylate synthase